MNYREKDFSWIACELCFTDDKKAHYYLEEAKRNKLHVVQVKNKYFALIINEYTYRK
jgi:hypothetical protein